MAAAASDAAAATTATEAACEPASDCLLLLIGLPGAGKTTLATRLQAELCGGVVHVCYDELIPDDVMRRVACGGDTEDDWKSRRAAIAAAVGALAGGGGGADAAQPPSSSEFERECREKLSAACARAESGGDREPVASETSSVTSEPASVASEPPSVASEPATMTIVKKLNLLGMPSKEMTISCKYCSRNGDCAEEECKQMQNNGNSN